MLAPPLVLHRVMSIVRAGDRTRTGDVQLGKLAFYQLNYAREWQTSSVSPFEPQANEPRSVAARSCYRFAPSERPPRRCRRR